MYEYQNTNLFQILILPFWKLFKLTVSDPTFGRKNLLKNQYEQKLIQSNQFINEAYLDYSTLGSVDNVYYQSWFDQTKFDEPVADVLFIHGHGDYGGRFARFSHHYLDRGFRVHAMDTPGHGRSDGVHCVVSGIQTMVNATARVVEHIRLEYQPRKLFLMGNSLGGLSTSLYCIERPNSVDGIILVCPCVENNLGAPPNPWKLAIAKLFTKLLPGVTMGPRKKMQTTTIVEEEEERCKDPMRYPLGMRLVTGLSVLDSCQFLVENFDKVVDPILLVQGDADRVVRWQSGQKLIDQCRSGDKQFILYEKCEHDIFVDPNGQSMYPDTIKWMEERL